MLWHGVAQSGLLLSTMVHVLIDQEVSKVILIYSLLNYCGY